MEDERRYRTRAGDERDSLSRSIYPSYIEPSDSSLASRSLLYPSAYGSLLNYEHIKPIRYRDYGLDDVPGLAVHTESGISGISGSGVNISNYLYPFEDTYNIPRTSDDTRISEPVYDRTSSLQRVEGLSSPDDSSMLFVDGLPRDCTRREVGHLFRPFIGFKDIRVVHKEPRRTGDKAAVLCFVEFDNPSCARTAMEALQGYHFDHKKADSPVLKIHFAQFPFKPPSVTDVR
ncbi:hypothetical protein V2J09_019627 [Rumex salicifolius]